MPIFVRKFFSRRFPQNEFIDGGVNDFFLLENNDFFLLEDGSYLILG